MHVPTGPQVMGALQVAAFALPVVGIMTKGVSAGLRTAAMGTTPSGKADLFNFGLRQEINKFL